MYDLRVGPREAPSLAIEVVGAVDREWTETWNVGPASSGRPWNVVGDWMLTIEPGTRIRTLRRDLPQLLVSLEGIGVSDVRVGHHRSRRVLGDELADALEALGVHSLACIDSAGSGKVHMTMPGQGGMVHVDGNLIADWVVRFLTHEEQADVLHKLSLATRARRREVFIAVTLMGAPWAVTSYLTDRLENLPGACPRLPNGIDGVWLAPTLSFHDALGVRWDGAEWSRFRIRGQGIDAV